MKNHVDNLPNGPIPRYSTGSELICDFTFFGEVKVVVQKTIIEGDCINYLVYEKNNKDNFYYVDEGDLK
jgi:hypothetical protein